MKPEQGERMRGIYEFYDDLWAAGRAAIESGSLYTDPFVCKPAEDHRLGLTFIVRPSRAVGRRLTTAAEYLRGVAPGVVPYRREQLHFTVLSLITAFDGFDLATVPVETYRALLGDVLGHAAPFQVEFRGLGATRSSIIAQGVPRDGSLEAIRSELRARLPAAGLGKGVDERYRLQGAHVTLGRFVDQIEPQRLIREIERRRSQPLGKMDVSEAELVVNDFFMLPGKVQTLAVLPIGSSG